MTQQPVAQAAGDPGRRWRRSRRPRRRWRRRRRRTSRPPRMLTLGVSRRLVFRPGARVTCRMTTGALDACVVVVRVRGKIVAKGRASVKGARASLGVRLRLTATGRRVLRRGVVATVHARAHAGGAWHDRTIRQRAIARSRRCSVAADDRGQTWCTTRRARRAAADGAGRRAEPDADPRRAGPRRVVADRRCDGDRPGDRHGGHQRRVLPAGPGRTGGCRPGHVRGRVRLHRRSGQRVRRVPVPRDRHRHRVRPHQPTRCNRPRRGSPLRPRSSRSAHRSRCRPSCR